MALWIGDYWNAKCLDYPLVAIGAPSILDTVHSVADCDDDDDVTKHHHKHQQKTYIMP